MTYAELLQKLQALSPEQLAQTVTVYDIDDDDTYVLHNADVAGKEQEDECSPAGTLDAGHFYLVRA